MKFSFDIRQGLKAHEVLANAAVEQIVEVQEDDPGMRIPVTMRGIIVGYGVLKRDGTFVAETEEGPEGRELMQMLLDGVANCISIGPFTASPKFREGDGHV